TGPAFFCCAAAAAITCNQLCLLPDKFGKDGAHSFARRKYRFRQCQVINTHVGNEAATIRDLSCAEWAIQNMGGYMHLLVGWQQVSTIETELRTAGTQAAIDL